MTTKAPVGFCRKRTVVPSPSLVPQIFFRPANRENCLCLQGRMILGDPPLDYNHELFRSRHNLYRFSFGSDEGRRHSQSRSVSADICRSNHCKASKRNCSSCGPLLLATSPMHHWIECRQTGVSQLPTTPPCKPQKWRLLVLATASWAPGTTGSLLKSLSSRLAKPQTALCR
jgi:hypothetical protein